MTYLRNLSRSSLLHRDHETSPRFCPLIHSPDMIWRPSAHDGWSLSWFIPMLHFEVIKNKPKHNKRTSWFQNLYKLKLLQGTMKNPSILHVGNIFWFFFPWYLLQKYMVPCVKDNAIWKGESEASYILWEILHSNQLFNVYFGQLFKCSELYNCCKFNKLYFPH